MKYPAILSTLYNTPHLITENKLRQIDKLLQRKLSGEFAVEFDADKSKPQMELVAVDDESRYQFTSEQLAAGNAVPATAATQRQFVAVLPLFGTLFQHGGMEMQASGGTSTDAWTKDLQRLDANPAVKTIVVESHTPGGTVYGTQEAADAMRMIRDAGRTRVVSIANSMMASAGMWIGTAANEVFVTPGGEIGSLGVVSVHWDYSKAYEAAGIKPTIIATSRKKVLGNDMEPLDSEALNQIQAEQVVLLERFISAMAANRKTSAEKVVANFGGGGMLFAEDAVKAGLADGIATMADVMTREVAMIKQSGRKSVKNKLAIATA